MVYHTNQSMKQQKSSNIDLLFKSLEMQTFWWETLLGSHLLGYLNEDEVAIFTNSRDKFACLHLYNGMLKMSFAHYIFRLKSCPAIFCFQRTRIVNAQDSMKTSYDNLVWMEKIQHESVIYSIFILRKHKTCTAC